MTTLIVVACVLGYFIIGAILVGIELRHVLKKKPDYKTSVDIIVFIVLLWPLVYGIGMPIIFLKWVIKKIAGIKDFKNNLEHE